MADNKNVVPGKWAFKRKRFPESCLGNCNARFCVCGDKQAEGFDYFEMYVHRPEVQQWNVVKCLLVILIVLK